MRELVNQHAVCHVVRNFLSSRLVVSKTSHRHASIDPATRAARGLPEDLIRLCVGIEDSGDLLDDLEHALFEAGAIELSTSTEQRYVRVRPRTIDPISRAVEKLTEDLSSIETGRPKVKREWLVSAPGKVILFGEHAVVYGVVREPMFWGFAGVERHIDRLGCIGRSSLLRSDYSTTRWQSIRPLH